MYFPFKKQYKYHPVTGKFRKQQDDQWFELSHILGHQQLNLSTSSSASSPDKKKLKSSDNENEEEEEKGENVDDRPLQSQDMFATDEEEEEEEEERPIESQNIFDDFDSEESQSLLIPKGD